MTILTAFGVVESISLSKQSVGGKVLRECNLSLLTETGRLVVFFNDLDDSASDPDQYVQRYPAMVELLTQCYLVEVAVTLGYESTAEGAHRKELREIDVTIARAEGPKGGPSKVGNVHLKGQGLHSASYQFSHLPPSEFGSSTLTLEGPLTQLSGAISAALVRGTGMRVIKEMPGTTTPSAVAISIHAD